MNDETIEKKKSEKQTETQLPHQRLPIVSENIMRKKKKQVEKQAFSFVVTDRRHDV